MKIAKFWRTSILKKVLENDITEERSYFALTLITGVASAVIAVSIHKITHFLTEFLGTNDTFDLKAFGIGGMFILISGWITTRKYPSTSGSGIPGVRVALAVFHGNITFKATFAKYLTSILSLSSGISLGREGPTAAICAGIGSAFGNAFHMSKKKVKALVAIGSAGGIAAAFNTPIAAVVFTLEEIVGDLNAKVLGAIIISSVVASVTAQALTGNDPIFTELHYKLNNPSELFFYLTIGISSAIVGPLWTKSVLKMRKTNMRVFRGHRLTIIMISFFIMGIISMIRPEVLGSGHNTIEETLLSLILDWRLLVSLFVFKFIATTISYSSGISGGLFMPTLLMGALLGSIIGSICQLFFPEIVTNTGAYALVGMGAYFAAVIRAPFTSILMIFELTRDYNIILPLMIANISSYWISSKIHNSSIYESISEQDGIHLPTREDNDILEQLHVEDAMVFEPVTLESKMSIQEAFKFIKGQPYSGYPLLQDGYLAGMVSVNEIAANYAKGEREKEIQDIAEKKPITIYPDQSLLVAFHKLNRFHVSRLPVVSRINDKKVIGIITAENIVSKFGYHIQDEKEFDFEKFEKEFLDQQIGQEKVEDDQKA